jgi:hypothetical protein
VLGLEAQPSDAAEGTNSAAKRARSPTPEPWDPVRAADRRKRKRLVRDAVTGVANRSMLNVVREGGEEEEEEQEGRTVVFETAKNGDVSIWRVP